MNLSIALIQGSFAAGNIAANVARIAAFHRMATIANADMVVFPEMAITGYPPEDLLFQEVFMQRSSAALLECAKLTQHGPAILIGGLWHDGGRLYNAVFLLEDGAIVARQAKHRLPNFGVFDEQRYFTSGALPSSIHWRGLRLGVLICEDMWHVETARALKADGAQLLICINASPFEIGKPATRANIAAARAMETDLALCYVNLVGGQDELVFDGGSFAMNAQGEVCSRLAHFREDFAVLTFERQGARVVPLPQPSPAPAHMAELEMLYRALVLGLRDFVGKNGFAGVVLGLSGGIDSAMAAAIAVDALGQSKVRALMLPSPFTSQESVEDAADCAQRLGIRLDTIPITAGIAAFSAMMAASFDGVIPDTIIGDIQPRMRAAILMAISRKDNLLLLNTGNKSEMATGYTTLYGDMCGHFGVLKDVYKTSVVELAQWRNGQHEVIPARVLSKAPSAELLSGQIDQDTLPPYAILDQVLYRLIEQGQGVDLLVESGFERDLVEKICGMLYGAEYKRRQAPPGPKVSTMSFWRDRRYPISNGWFVEQLGRRITDKPG
ncbi:MAG TPA: NAD+ synthase [Burkholderiaceae bacterium]